MNQKKMACLFFLLLTVSFASAQNSAGGKYGFYLYSTITNDVSLSTVDLKSEFWFNVSKVGQYLDASFRGTLINLRNANKTGEVVGILYANQDIVYRFNVSYIMGTYGITFTNTTLSYLYFVTIDFRINSVIFNPDFTDSTNLKTIYIKSFLKSNISQTLASLGLKLFDPEVQSFNGMTMRLSNDSGKLRSTMFFNFYADYIVNSQSSLITIQNIAMNNNWTLFNSFSDIFSIYSTNGFRMNEYYVTGSMNVPVRSYQPNIIADYINSVYYNVVNLLLPYGVFFQAEVLNINYATGIVDFHGSMLTRSPLLSDLNNLVLRISPQLSYFNFSNIVIYNIYRANIYAFVTKDVLTMYSSNNRSFVENMQNYVMSSLMQSNLVLLDKSYFNFGLEFLTRGDQIGFFSYFLVYSPIENLIEVDKQIKDVIFRLPSIIDPFNTIIDKYHRYSGDVYPFNNSANTNDTTIFPTTPPATTKHSASTTQSIWTDDIYTLNSPATTIKPPTTINTATTTPITTETTSTTTPTTTTTTTIQITTNTFWDTYSDIFGPQKSTKKPSTPTTTTPITTETTSTTTPTTTTTTIIPTTTTPTTTIPKTTTPTIKTTTTPTTTTTTSTPRITATTTPTTTAKILSTTTVANAKPGETESGVNVKCSFNETYKPEYNDSNSKEFQEYSKSIIDKLLETLLKTALKILKIVIKSIRQGSVIVDMDVITASSNPMNQSILANIVSNATSEAFNNTAKILSASVTYAFVVTEASTLSTNSKATSTVPGQNPPAPNDRPSCFNLLKINFITLFSFIGISVYFSL